MQPVHSNTSPSVQTKDDASGKNATEILLSFHKQRKIVTEPTKTLGALHGTWCGNHNTPIACNNARQKAG